MASQVNGQPKQGLNQESEGSHPNGKPDVGLAPVSSENTSAPTPSENVSQDRLIVLVKDVGSTKSMANYLNRRGVETFVTSQLNDAVDRLTQGWTRFVLLSVNFPHPKVELIPQLFAQSFSAETISFGESSDRKTAQRLTASRSKNVIFGTASGPIVLMRLKQAQRSDDDSTDQTETTRSSSMTNNIDEDVRVKGIGAANRGQSVHLKGSSAPADSPEARREAASRFLRALSESGSESAGRDGMPQFANSQRGADSREDAAGGSIESRAASDGAGIIVQKGVKGAAPSSAADQVQAGSTAGLAGAVREGGPGKGRDLGGELGREFGRELGRELEHESKQQGRKGSDRPTINQSQASRGGELGQSQAAQRTAKHRMITPVRKSKVLEALQSGQLSRAPSGSARRPGNNRKSESMSDARSANETAAMLASKSASSPSDLKSGDVSDPSLSKDLKKAAGDSASGSAESRKDSQLPYESVGEITKGDPKSTQEQGAVESPSVAGDALSEETSTQSDVEYAARAALRKVYGEPRKERDTLLEYRSVAILIVHIDSFTGTIMLAEGRGTSSASTKLPHLEREFLNALGERGHEIRIGDLQSMPFPNPAVAEDAFLAADMSAVSRNEDYEAGIAFLDLVPSAAVFEETADEMLKIGIEELEPNARINFDVFIYLPINSKYLKYVRQGQAISSEQSDRLKGREVSHLYLEKQAKDQYVQHNLVKGVRKGLKKKAAA